MSNQVVAALERAAKEVVHALGEGASKAEHRLLHETADNLETAAKRHIEHDGKAAKTIEGAASRHGEIPTVKEGGSVRDASDAASPPHSSESDVDPNRVDRGDGRDAKGRFTGEGGYGKDHEAEGLDNYETRTGRTVERTQVRAHHDDVDNHRYYDGLSEKDDGTYEGVEVKSGGADRDAKQRDFDGSVSYDRPARTKLNGRDIKITSVHVEKA